MPRDLVAGVELHRVFEKPLLSQGTGNPRPSPSDVGEALRSTVRVRGEVRRDPDRSSHVTGRAVDIAPVDAQFWLIEHGASYGICQTYANERWHFELVTEPGVVCPPMKPDAAS